MSRQFDEYMEDKFEYQGELKSLIEPTSFPELVSALSVRDTLQAIIDLHCERRTLLVMRN